jgi:hypothetical protein
VRMSIMFTKGDWEFLKSVGISAERAFDDMRLELEPMKPEVKSGITRPDGTVRLLEKFGIPVTRENYLQLAFAGNPPEEPLDQEIEEQLPIELQITESPSGGQSDEPNHTTHQGIPLCSKCGRSTRNRNELVCAPCRNRTRLLLTAEDRHWLRQMGIAR